MDQPAPRYERIFIVTHEGVGDFVFMLPTLHLLRANLPDAAITIKVVDVQRPLASTIDGTLVTTCPARNHEFVRLARIVRQFAPDVYFDFDGALRYAVIGRLSGAGRRIHPPREIVKRWSARFHHERLPLNRGGHRVETLLAVIEMLGLKRGKIAFDFDVPDEYRRRAAALADECIPPGSIALVPNSGVALKNWPAKSVQAVVNVLARDMKRNVVVVGRYKYADLAHAHDLAGRSDFLTDAFLLRYSGLFDLVIGVDTGMMQIAGSVSSDADGGYAGVTGNRTISLFGPTAPEIYRPYDPTGRINLVIGPREPSKTMSAFGWAEDRHSRKYMNEIETAAILEAVELQLRK